MLIGKKIGMTRVFKENGEVVPTTVIKASPVYVLGKREEEKDGYNAFILGFGKKEKNFTRPIEGICKKAGVDYMKVIREFRTDDLSLFEVGDEVPVTFLEEGELVDIVGTSKGKGFQGVVKRWGFKGGPDSHGSKFHRAPGTAGAGTDPGRVVKGKKFPGRMGGDRTTIKNLEVVKVDEESGVIGVKGSVPGANEGIILIKKKEFEK